MTDMNRLYIIFLVMIILSSCKENTCSTVIELQNQQIGVSSAHNARQLGGYCIDGRHIRQDLLIRTARLSSLSEADSILLADKYKVQCIYDFRGQDEALISPDVIPGDARYVSLSISFGDTGGNSRSNAGSEAEMVKMLLENADNPLVQAMCEKMYDKIFFDEASQEVYRRFFDDLVNTDPEKGAILWHCTQGKDRAGSASAMLLAALGADRDLIMADFRLSKDYYDPLIASIPVETESQRNVIGTLVSANPVLFQKTLDKVDAEYGSLRNYLTECIGVTPEIMDILRERYLEDPAVK